MIWVSHGHSLDRDCLDLFAAHISPVLALLGADSPLDLATNQPPRCMSHIGIQMMRAGLGTLGGRSRSIPSQSHSAAQLKAYRAGFTLRPISIGLFEVFAM